MELPFILDALQEAKLTLFLVAPKRGGEEGGEEVGPESHTG